MSRFEPESDTSVEVRSAQNSSQPSILIGPWGLRAGWAMALYLALAMVAGFIIFYAIAGSTGTLGQIKSETAAARAISRQSISTGVPIQAPPLKVRPGLVLEVAQTGAVLLAALTLSYLERRRFRVYGLPGHALGQLLPGALWGLVAIGTLVGTLRATHVLIFDRQLLHGGAIAAYGATWLLFFFTVGLYEEFLFRGYIQFTLMRGLLGLARRIAPARERLVAFWLSALVWSGVFFAAHITNSGEGPAGLASVFLAGILFSYALWRTGSLWWGIGFHMTWDWSQSFLFGVPDSGSLSQGRLFATHPAGNPLLSGGIAGPEGSLLMLPVLLLIFAVLRVHRHADQPPVEPQGHDGETLAGHHRLESESA